MKPAVDNSIKNLLSNRLIQLETHFNADFLVYYGPIVDGNENVFLKIVEDIATEPRKER